MTKSNQIITGILGVSMFMFGILKFINPFKTWYSVQIIKSELPFYDLSFWSGQIGEIFISLLLLFALRYNTRVSNNIFNKIFTIGNIGVIIIMIMAFYVHLHPNVPADVLPLKIRTPYIPGLFLLLAVLNLYIKHYNLKQ
ncbi:hypothetical protein SAMN05444281_1560 [Wenyingzhuangia marina]|uniref:DoxX-like family protein n=1 Tax=Wenyingzhuangia marina TaxID=1195760 RepID=A0A1M5V6V9_9FLAO|nr:hypothetical protein GCM10011397_16180 [Wenyingzhuangia marina]SHH70956.1 hypothetical protein SAMN05444281_1560 [Wenyingzhuangia marina]